MVRKKCYMAAIHVETNRYEKNLLGRKGEKKINPDIAICKTKTKGWTLLNCFESWKHKCSS